MSKRTPLLLSLAIPALVSGQLLAGTLNPTGRDITLSMPLISEGRTLGDVLMEMDTDDNIKLDSKSFLNLMQNEVSPAHLQKLQGLVGKTESFPWFVLGVLGYNISYDQSKLELKITLPAQVRATKKIGGPRARPKASNAELPTQVSAYMNLRAGVSRDDYNGLENTDESLALDGAISIPGAAHATIENESRLNDNDDLVREGTRIVIDNRDRHQRWEVGDVTSANFSHMGSESIAGISVDSNRSTFSSTTSRVTGRTSFALVRKSTVRVFVNGTLRETLRLEAGPYELEDIAVDYGSNQVTLEIEDETGKVETQVFNLYSDNTFLAKGASEYNFAVGVERTDTTGQKIEYSDDAIASGYYRRGVTEQLTLGGFARTKKDVNMAGGEALIGAAGGRLSIEGAATKDDEGGELEYAVNGGFNYQVPKHITNKDANIFIGSRYQTNRFDKTLTETSEEEKVSSRVTYRQRVTPDLALALRAEHTVNRTEEDEKEIGLDLGFSKNNLYLSLSLEQSLETDDTSAQVRLTQRLTPRSSIQASYDFDDQSEIEHVAQSQRRGVGEWNRRLGVSYNEASKQSSLDFSGQYKANRAELTGYHSETVADGQGRIGNVSNVTVSSAVAYAGGKLGIGRPVEDSFMILNPHDNLDGRKVYANPKQNGDYEASSGLLGPAVYGRAPSYSESTVTYDVENLPLGYNLGEGARKVFPTYKSGYQTVVGSSATVSAIGTLYDAQGRVVKLRSGQATPVNAETSEAVTVFTNSSGRFSAQGLSPGTWELVIKSKTGAHITYAFEVPPGTVGLWRAGKLSPA